MVAYFTLLSILWQQSSQRMSVLVPTSRSGKPVAGLCTVCGVAWRTIVARIEFKYISRPSGGMDRFSIHAILSEARNLVNNKMNLAIDKMHVGARLARNDGRKSTP